MLKITYIISKLSYGGSINHVIDLLNYNIKFKIPLKQHLIILIKPEINLYNLIPKDVEILQCDFKNFRSYHQFSETKRIINFLINNNITIVHTHDSAPNFIGTIAAKRASTPLIISTEHTFDDLRIKKTPIFLYRRLKEYIRLRHTNRIIIISNSIGNYLLKHTRFSEKKIAYIPHGVFIKKYKEAKTIDLSIKSNIIKIALVGRLCEVKNHIFLIEVLKIIRGNIKKYHFFFAGDGELRNLIEKKIKNYCLGNYITILGNISWIPSLLKSVDAVVMPSLWEGCPLVVLETMASGKAVICNDVCGLNEIITHNCTGILVKKNDVEEWKKVLHNLTKNELLRLGKNAQIEAEKKYNINKMIYNTYNFYLKSLKDLYGT